VLPSLAHPFLNGPTNWISSISCFYAVSDESLRPRKDLLRANKTQIVDAIRWDEKAGVRRDAVRSQVIDALEAQKIKETGNEED